MYKLVCIDMDGTLLSSKRVISDANREALIKAHDMGVHIVIATGRIYINAEYYSNLIGVKSPVIAANGAIIKEKQNSEFIYKCLLPIDINNKILEICNKHKVFPRFHTDRDIYYGKGFLHYTNLIFYYGLVLKIKSKKHKVKMHHIKNVDQWKKILISKEKEIIKCEIYSSDEEKIIKVQQELKAIKNIQIVSSSGHGHYGVEITNKGVSKGSAVEYLAKKYKIKKEEIITIGDGENDIEMIEYAGLGVAMGNGLEILRGKADYVTATNDDDGVAEVINKFILNKKSDYNSNKEEMYA